MTYYSSELLTLSRYNIPYRLLQGLFPGNIPVVKCDTPLRADGPPTEDEEAWRFTKAQRAAPTRIRRRTGLANDMGFRTPLYPEPERPCELVLNWSPMLLSSTITRSTVNFLILLSVEHKMLVKLNPGEYISLTCGLRTGDAPHVTLVEQPKPPVGDIIDLMPRAVSLLSSTRSPPICPP